jgi:hypothetical protein
MLSVPRGELGARGCLLRAVWHQQIGRTITRMGLWRRASHEEHEDRMKGHEEPQQPGQEQQHVLEARRTDRCAEMPIKAVVVAVDLSALSARSACSAFAVGLTD